MYFLGHCFILSSVPQVNLSVRVVIGLYDWDLHPLRAVIQVERLKKPRI